ncbi:hypothetical protein F2Q70_00009431 [Brassica cretica]|uniref:Uncharacterized protein n=1 Tax=Brassica cretica TaxID=69181 RepID=A0A8S9LZW4_BRACR|nr:hypothetical protein F2Q70_00009431 [Brassica cretica]
MILRRVRISYCGEFGLATAASSDSEESGASSLTNDLENEVDDEEMPTRKSVINLKRPSWHP